MKFYTSFFLLTLLFSCSKDKKPSVDCPAEEWQHCVIGQWKLDSRSSGVGYPLIAVENPDLLVLYSNNTFESYCNNCDNPKNYGVYTINNQDSTLFFDSEVFQKSTYRIFELKNRELLVFGRMGRHGFTEERFIWVDDE